MSTPRAFAHRGFLAISRGVSVSPAHRAGRPAAAKEAGGKLRRRGSVGVSGRGWGGVAGGGDGRADWGHPESTGGGGCNLGPNVPGQVGSAVWSHRGAEFPTDRLAPPERNALQKKAGVCGATGGFRPFSTHKIKT